MINWRSGSNVWRDDKLIPLHGRILIGAHIDVVPIDQLLPIKPVLQDPVLVGHAIGNRIHLKVSFHMVPVAFVVLAAGIVVKIYTWR